MIPEYMKALVTTGTGGYEKLEYQDVPVPSLSTGEVLIQVLAAGVNNTDINTRTGWYRTEEQKSGEGWNGKTVFPLIQGADCCGRIITTASDVDRNLEGKRIIVPSCMSRKGRNYHVGKWLGTDINGAFAQYVKIPARYAFPLESDLTDAELACIPCAFGTAENMLDKITIRKGDHILVPGASGSVGSAVVQLAKGRGAFVTGITSKAWIGDVLSAGADNVLLRGVDLLSVLGENSIDTVVDNVGGSELNIKLQVLKRGGSYVTSGAIAGPVVTLDLRLLYLKDIKMIGSTAWDEAVFPRLLSYLGKGEIKPVLAKTFPLEKMAEAQKEFLDRKLFGKLVLIPPDLP